jgi:hypothetical protein
MMARVPVWERNGEPPQFRVSLFESDSHDLYRLLICIFEFHLTILYGIN